MSGGTWVGTGEQRRWIRPGSRLVLPDDSERGARLFAALAGERFWCERCGGTHALADMRLCHDYTYRDVR